MGAEQSASTDGSGPVGPVKNEDKRTARLQNKDSFKGSIEAYRAAHPVRCGPPCGTARASCGRFLPCARGCCVRAHPRTAMPLAPPGGNELTTGATVEHRHSVLRDRCGPRGHPCVRAQAAALRARGGKGGLRCDDRAKRLAHRRARRAHEARHAYDVHEARAVFVRPRLRRGHRQPGSVRRYRGERLPFLSSCPWLGDAAALCVGRYRRAAGAPCDGWRNRDGVYVWADWERQDLHHVCHPRARGGAALPHGRRRDGDPRRGDSGRDDVCRAGGECLPPAWVPIFMGGPVDLTGRGWARWCRARIAATC